VRGGGAVGTGLAAAAGRRRLEARVAQVALQGPGTGQIVLALLGQHDADVRRAPAGMLATAVEDRGAIAAAATTAAVAGEQGGARHGELAQEPADGTRGQAEGSGDGRGGVALGMKFEQALTERSRDGTGHGAPPRKGQASKGGRARPSWRGQTFCRD
jgi:hypothetical protein